MFYELDEKIFLFNSCAFSKCCLNRFASMSQGWQKYDVLSEFPNRIARVSTVGVPSLTSAVAVYTQLLSLPIFSLSDISGVTISTTLQKESTVMICTDFQSLISAHYYTRFIGRLVFQEFYVAGASFFPLIRLLRKSEQLGATRQIRQDSTRAYILNSTDSSSSLVVTATSSTSLTTGSKCTSGLSGASSPAGSSFNLSREKRRDYLIFIIFMFFLGSKG